MGRMHAPRGWPCAFGIGMLQHACMHAASKQIVFVFDMRARCSTGRSVHKQALRLPAICHACCFQDQKGPAGPFLQGSQGALNLQVPPATLCHTLPRCLQGTSSPGCGSDCPSTVCKHCAASGSMGGGVPRSWTPAGRHACSMAHGWARCNVCMPGACACRKRATCHVQRTS